MRNGKGGVGDFQVYHTGKCEYTVEDRKGREATTKHKNMSAAFSCAKRLYDARKNPCEIEWC